MGDRKSVDFEGVVISKCVQCQNEFHGRIVYYNVASNQIGRFCKEAVLTWGGSANNRPSQSR